MTGVIDSHHHFWRLDRGDYGWLTPALVPLYRDFGPEQLAPLLQRHGVTGTVLVQAAPTEAETRFLLELADRHDFVRGVIGWVDFERPDAPERIARLAAHPKLVGLRPMVQDIADDDWLLRPDLAPALGAVVTHGLAFDALVRPRHLKRLAVLRDRHPELRIVLDHGGKPAIRDRDFDIWAAGIAAVAADGRTCCKLSGLLTEAAPGADARDLRPYVDHLLAGFGPGRLLFGSDWPVLTLAGGYGVWIAMVRGFLAELSGDERAAVMGGNAMRVYGLG